MKRVIIIGGGISGLATAYLIKQQALAINQELELTLLEKEPRIGGKVWSIRSGGYLCEWGPNGFLTNKPQTLELCASLGISEQLVASNDNARKRFVFADQKLHKLPHTPKEFISNSLISWRGKFRILGELFVSSRKSLEDESLADFARRRLGQEALDKLITPMASGIFAGDPETMSLAACFPRINQLEREYGGLLKALFSLAKHRSKDNLDKDQGASPAGPGGVLTSFAGGLQVLTDKLSAEIGSDNIILNCKIEAVNHNHNGEYMVIAEGRQLLADALVVATPAYVTKTLLSPLLPQLEEPLSKIAYSPLVVVCLGYSLSDIDVDLNGFGYLLAKGEKIPVLGTLWDSSIFVERAPDGKVLFRTMLGGATRPDLIELDDQQILELVRQSLASILGIDATPDLVKIFRHQNAIPQYRVGHQLLVKEINKLSAQFPGLFITGNAYYGVGINDCVAAAYQVSQKVSTHLY